MDAADDGELPAELREFAATLAQRARQIDLAGRPYLASGEHALRRAALNIPVGAPEKAVHLLRSGEVRNEVTERLLDAQVAVGRIDDVSLLAVAW